ncbi:MAG TPA: LemA family protein [Armatimonadota bacterium]|jgi:LemA protein
MKGWQIGCGIFGVLIVLLLLILGGSYVSVYNNLNTKYQIVNGARSRYSSALNLCSQKIEGVWEIANQYLKHESETFTRVAEARSGYQAAAQAYQAALKNGTDTRTLTEAGSGAVQAALAFRIQVEAYPQLRGAETSQENIRNMEVATNEIKTALDDWITTIRDYNTYRGSFWPNLVGSLIGKFPAQIDYYEGPTKELDVEKLNPQKKK